MSDVQGSENLCFASAKRSRLQYTGRRDLLSFIRDNSFRLVLRSPKYLIVIFCVLALVLGYAYPTVIGPMAERNDMYREKPMFAVLIWVAVTLITIALLQYAKKRQYSAMLSIMIAALPVMGVLDRNGLVLYQDDAGYKSFLGAIALFPMVVLFFVLADVITRRARISWLVDELRWTFMWIALLFLAVATTQVMRLGIGAGLAMTLLRVGIPAIVLFLTLASVREISDLHVLMFAIVACLLVASVLRLSASGAIGDTYHDALGTPYRRAWLPGFAYVTGYGLVMAAGVPLTLGLMAASSRRWIRLLLVAMTAAFIVETIQSHTRGAILGLLAVLPVFLSPRFLRKVRGILIMVVAGTVLGAKWLYDLVSIRPLWGYEWLSDATVVGRMHRLGDAWAFIRANPLIGLGFGKVQPPYSPDISFYVYNGFLAWWVFGGVVAALAFVAINLRSLLAGWRAIRSSKRSSKSDLTVVALSLNCSFLVFISGQITSGESMTYLTGLPVVIIYFVELGLLLAAARLARDSVRK